MLQIMKTIDLNHVGSSEILICLYYRALWLQSLIYTNLKLLGGLSE